MNQVEWKIVEKYEMNDERLIGIVETKIGQINITITRHPDYSPDDWVLIYSYDVSGDRTIKQLLSKDLEKAKTEAIRFLKKKIERVGNGNNDMPTL